MEGSEGKDVMVSFVATFLANFSKAGSLRFAWYPPCFRTSSRSWTMSSIFGISIGLVSANYTWIILCQYASFQLLNMVSYEKVIRLTSCHFADKGDMIIVYFHSFCRGKARCVNLLPYSSVSRPLPSLTLCFGLYQISYTPKFLKNWSRKPIA